MDPITVPPGGRVLTAAEAQEFDALTKLGSSSELKAQLEELPGLRTFKADTAREKIVVEAATALGWNATALGRLTKFLGLTIEFKDVRRAEDGQVKTERVPHVKPADDANAEAVPLTQEYAEQHFADLLPALVTTGTRRRPAPPDARRAAVEYPGQTGTQPPHETQSEKKLAEQKAAKVRSGVYGSGF